MTPLQKPFSKHEGHKGHKVFKTLRKFRHVSCEKFEDFKLGSQESFVYFASFVFNCLFAGESEIKKPSFKHQDFQM